MSAPLDSIAADSGRSYGQILKSSALIGGSSIITLGASIVRGKTIAVLLGPEGVGLMGLYASILDLAQSVAGLGLSSSGVRHVAEAQASGDEQRIARTAAVLSRTSLVFGVLGSVTLAIFSRPISVWTFGTPGAAWLVVALSAGVLFRVVSDGQGAVVQGMRRIGDLALRSIITTVAAATATVLLVLAFGELGIVPALVAANALTLLISCRFRRRLSLPSAPRLGHGELRVAVVPLLQLGLAFMASSVLTTGAAYVIRVLVRNSEGVEAAGLYQSAWAIGGIYVAFILQAMGSDFYPRLTGVAHDDEACNRLVNEQALVGLLLAGPGVIATLAFAPLIIWLLYDSSFEGAVQPLRWICIGMALRVVAWPMGYIILAKGLRRLFLLTDLAAAFVHVGLTFLLLPFFGLLGACMAFAGLYVWHTAFVFVAVRRLTGFRWSSTNLRLAWGAVLLVCVVFAATSLLPSLAAMLFGGVIACAAAVYSLRQLAQLVPFDRTPRYVQAVLQKCRLAPAA